MKLERIIAYTLAVILGWLIAIVMLLIAGFWLRVGAHIAERWFDLK